ncbi:MAG TPA: chemotaxis response regulator protein-glutamate methylesterase [Clostridia bacterium]|nr:chemotaxis response regulator protein-glutamate methylesterase [Clostridia bacterium]
MVRDIGVLVVDDSAFMRKMLTDILESSRDIKVVGTARDGLEALKKVKELNPDIITLDVEMPSMDGLSCLKELQKITDTPVIMLSSHTGTGEKATIEALEAGALDFITKPTGLFDISGEEKKKEIIEKVKMARLIGPGRYKAERPVSVLPQTKAAQTARTVRKYNDLKTLVVIGTSTGGPKALQEVIPFIPEDIPAALVIVQHMPPGFTKSLAERLNTLSRLTVKEGENNEVIRPGFAYIAPGDFHMEVYSEGPDMKIRLTKNPPIGSLRPAVNVLMDSVAKTEFPNVIGVVMTGMGNDGKDGIVKMKKANNAIIISQDEQSCVVYGMPKSAVSTGVVDAIVPLKEISEVIVKYMGVDQ